MHTHWSQFVPKYVNPTSEDIKLYIINEKRKCLSKMPWVSRGTSAVIRFGTPFSSKGVLCGLCLVTLSFTINETLKQPLSLLPILMQVFKIQDYFLISSEKIKCIILVATV